MLSILFDFVVIALGTLTMLYVVRMILDLAINSLVNFAPEQALQGIVLVLIFLEIFEIIVMYIIYHHVPMKNVVEIGVLALVKELLITLDLTELGWGVLLGMAALIAAMGWVYTRERQREDSYKRFLIEHGITEEDADELTKTLGEVEE
nr:phosphate-starvation-inducible PsiE family protein [Thermococcus sp. JdF3]